ncbi:MAG: hypothetical protein AAFX65_07470 [Cyanobacteria bacterium J06638_7]
MNEADSKLITAIREYIEQDKTNNGVSDLLARVTKWLQPAPIDLVLGLERYGANKVALRDLRSGESIALVPLPESFVWPKLCEVSD